MAAQVDPCDVIVGQRGIVLHAGNKRLTGILAANFKKYGGTPVRSRHSFIVELMTHAVSTGVRFVSKTNGKLTEVETGVAEEFIANKFRTMKRKPGIRAAKKHSCEVNNSPATGAHLNLCRGHHGSRRIARMRSAL
jgi:hypothetical protein